jgi:hypothetical protein
MKLSENQVKILDAAIEQWGTHQQVIKAVEELGELSQALCKWLNLDTPVKSGSLSLKTALDGIHKETADVTLMLEQIKKIFGDKTQFYGDAKLRRLRTYLPIDPIASRSCK